VGTSAGEEIELQSYCLMSDDRGSSNLEKLFLDGESIILADSFFTQDLIIEFAW